MRIRLLWSGVDVEPLKAQIADHPEIWNRYRARTKVYQHSQVSDIWVRYNAFENFDGDLAKFNDSHESVWYPESALIPAVKDLCFEVMAHVRGERLGGVLITRIPAHGRCLPHRDGGWHASYYDKFAVQLAANDKQAFHFEGESLITKPGDVFTFDNAFTHWVTNDSDEDRMTLIICVRTEHSRRM